MLVNAVLATTLVPPFLREEDLDSPARRLRTLCDVTCDVGSPFNVLPVYDRTTDWTEPVRRLRKEPPLDLIAIDNLPSLLPRESSADFSAAPAAAAARLRHRRRLGPLSRPVPPGLP